MSKSKLTAKQKQFCKEYLIDLNATQAAIRAGYSKKTARTIAAQNLAKLNIAEYVQELMNKRSEKVEISSDWVLKGIKDLTDKLVGGEDPSKAYKGFELAGRHLKLFTEKFEVEANLVITEIKRKIV